MNKDRRVKIFARVIVAASWLAGAGAFVQALLGSSWS